MKIELVIFIITGLLIANTYYEGKLVKILNTVKRALHIIYIDDITIQEYELAQQEIEELVNPIINNLAFACST